MKLTYLANVRFPSERAHAAQITHMCQAFAAAGYDVTLITNARGEGTLASVATQFGIEPRFRLVTVPPSKLYGDSKLAFVLREIVFTFSCWARHRKNFGEVIYSRDEWVLYLLSWLAPKARLVYESHEAKYNRAVRRLVARQVPVIAISEGIRDFYLANDVPESQLIVAHDGIDESFFEPASSKQSVREKLDLSQDAFIAMYIGGFDTWKGVETFFQAAELSTSTRFVAIGGKPSEVERFAVQYPRVHFKGERPYRELRDNQQAADVLVIPNTALNKLSANYTSPLKLFAHLASGVPIVVSDVESIQNVVDHDVVTWFAPDDAEQLASAIETVKAEYELKQSLANRAKESAVQWTWRGRAAVIDDFIKETSNEKDY